LICNYCKRDNPPGVRFCNFDGMPLFPEQAISPVHANARLILPNRTIELEEKEASFGKEDFINDVPTSKIQYISKKLKPHFRIIKDNDRFYLEDNNSVNGTKVNDIEINPKKGGNGKQELKDGDKILIASILKIEFQYLS
jgi:pSer/pThr/pTyr-binding forkhead associated (FHA) protein